MKDITISRRSLLVSAGLLALAPLAGCGGNSGSGSAAAGATADIPIVGCAITDYAASGLVQDNDKPGTNVTGASDLTPVAEQLEMMQKVLPDVKKVGLLYCTAESNSDVQIKAAKKELDKLGLEYTDFTVSSSNEIQSVVESAVALCVPVVWERYKLRSSYTKGDEADA